MAEFKKGDKVSWQSHGGTAHGTVEKKQTSETTIKGHKVAASKDNPEFIVKSDKGGKAGPQAGRADAGGLTGALLTQRVRAADGGMSAPDNMED